MQWNNDKFTPSVTFKFRYRYFPQKIAQTHTHAHTAKSNITWLESSQRVDTHDLIITISSLCSRSLIYTLPAKMWNIFYFCDFFFIFVGVPVFLYLKYITSSKYYFGTSYFVLSSKMKHTGSKTITLALFLYWTLVRRHVVPLRGCFHIRLCVN